MKLQFISVRHLLWALLLTSLWLRPGIAQPSAVGTGSEADSLLFCSFIYADEIGEKTVLPFAVLSRFFPTDFSCPAFTQEVFARYAIPYFNDVWGLVFSIGCTAGGYCQEYYLIAYSEKEGILNLAPIGLAGADLTWEQTIDFRRSSPSSFILVETEGYRNEEEEIVKELQREYTILVDRKGNVVKWERE